MTVLLQQLPRTSLGPDPRVPLVHLIHPPGHRAFEAGNFVGAREQAASEAQLDLLPAPVDRGADGEETIRGPEALVSRGISASNGDPLARLLDDFEVVCEESALFVSAL